MKHGSIIFLSPANRKKCLAWPPTGHPILIDQSFCSEKWLRAILNIRPPIGDKRYYR